MGRRLLLLVALIVSTISACNRPEGGWRNRNQDPVEPTQAGPVQLPEVEAESPDQSGELLDELEGLLNDLDAVLGSENEWQLDVPNDIEVESNSQDYESRTDDQANAAAIDDLLNQLVTSLGALDLALLSEGSQQVDPP